MIIDAILDRYAGDAYEPKEFYDSMMAYEEGTNYPISRAMDYGEEEGIRRELCAYIDDSNYNPKIKDFINAVDWLEPDDGKDYSKEIDILGESKKESLDRWGVEFGDIYRNVMKEYFDTEEDAKERYTELAERTDIEWVEDPILIKAEKTEKLSYSDYAAHVEHVLMGWEFNYGPETAHQFVVDDYKNIVYKNYTLGKDAFFAAADIDDAYMGKE